MESRAVRHVSRRALRRRNQVNTAIMLLAAVIVLALILIWVLQRGGQSTAGHLELNGSARSSAAITCHTLS